MEFLKFIATNRTNFGEVFWNTITKFGEETIIIVLLCIIYWCINKNLAHIIGFTFFISGYLVQGLKISFRIDRPWVLDPTFKPVDAAYDTATGYSFPSGHTQSASAIFGSLGFFFKHWSKYLLFIIPIAVAFSRMYLGVHTPKDVITALVMTLLISFIISILHQKLNVKFLNLFLLLTIVLGFGLLIYAFILYKNQIIDYSYVSDCCKTAGAGIGFSIGIILEQKFIKFNPKNKHLLIQIFKVVFGIIGLLIIQIGLKEVFILLFEESLIADFSRYMLMIFWVAYIWPLIFQKVINKQNKLKKEYL